MDDVEWPEPALICLNGHVVNARSESRPHFNSNYCPICGELAIDTCPDCHAPIPGQVRYFSPEADTHGYGADFEEPAPYCGGCGKPYPWTERRARAFIELAQLELSPEAARDVETELPDVMKDTPRTEVAVRRIKMAFETTGKGGLEILKRAAPGILTQGALVLIEHLLGVK